MSPVIQDGQVRALLVMPRGRRQAWEETLKSLDVAVNPVSHNSRAQEILVAGERPDFILTDEILTDGDWRQLVEEALDRDPDSLIVVCARSAPDTNFWSEALHWGAYDVIADPNNQTALASLVRTAALRRGMIRTPKKRGTRSLHPHRTALPSVGADSHVGPRGDDRRDPGRKPSATVWRSRGAGRRETGRYKSPRPWSVSWS